MCGVNVGRFTRDLEEVTCSDCLDLIFRTLTRNDGLVTIEERDHDWVAKVTAEPSPINALKALIKTRPYLLDGLKT